MAEEGLRVVVHRGPWRAVWYGGRLADIYHADITEYPLDCVRVGEYSFAWDAAEVAANRAAIERQALREALDSWVDAHADVVTRELPYMR